MAIKVTENWSGSKLSLVPPWEGVREFVVSGTQDAGAALVAVDPTTGLTIPQRGVGHPNNPTRLLCDGPMVKERSGIDLWTITCHYSLNQGNFTEEDPDPLKLPPKITWTPAFLSIPVDHDLDFKAIVNAANDLYQGETREIPFKILRVVKNLPYYDILLSKSYEMAANSGVVTLSGIVTVAVEHMLCRTIGPVIQDYAPSAPFLPIGFEFWVMGETVNGKYPWQHRFLNAGRNGWYSDARTSKAALGRFVNPRGDPLDFDVKLDHLGLPLNKPYLGAIGSGPIYVGSPKDGSTFTPVATPTTAQPYKIEYYLGTGTQIPSFDSAKTEAVIFYYKKVRVVDLGPLFSIIG